MLEILKKSETFEVRKKMLHNEMLMQQSEQRTDQSEEGARSGHLS